MRKSNMTNLAHALTGFITSVTMDPSESTNFPPIKLGTHTYRNPISYRTDISMSPHTET